MLHLTSQSFPKVFSILKFFWQKLQKVLFYKHYKISHRRYLKEKYKERWLKLTDDISCKLILEDIYCNDTFPVSRLYIKPNRFNKKDVLVVDLSFIAQHNETHYAQNIVHYFCSNNTAVFKLTNIPLIQFNFTNCRASYEKYFIRVNKIVLNEHCIEKNVKSLEHHLTFFNELNGEFIEKWGMNWNLNLYKSAKKELYFAVAASLLENVILLHHSLNSESIYLKIRRFVVKVLLKDKCLNFIFWSLVIFGLARVTHQGTLISRYLSVDACRRFLKLNDLRFSA